MGFAGGKKDLEKKCQLVGHLYFRKCRSFFLKLLKTVLLSAKLCFQRKLNVFASSLTYYTFFALIPILAFFFAIGRGFGMDQLISDFFRDLLSSSTNSKSVVMIVDMVELYLQHARGGLFVGIGIIFLLWSVYNVFTQIEKSINDIWGIKTSRPMIRRFTDYFSLTLIIPLIIIISSGLSVYVDYFVKMSQGIIILSPLTLFLLWLKPWFISSLICTMLYTIIPNTPVKFGYAVIAGMLAGGAILLFKAIYIWGLAWMTQYNFVYGSLASIPILMLFLRTLWIIVLCGAEVCFASQKKHMFDYEKEIEEMSLQYKLILELYLTSIIAKRFDQGLKPLSFTQISELYTLPPKLVMTLLDSLCRCGVLFESRSEEKGREELVYLPAYDINKMTVGKVAHNLNCNGEEDFIDIKSETYAEIRNILLSLNGKLRLEFDKPLKLL